LNQVQGPEDAPNPAPPARLPPTPPERTGFRALWLGLIGLVLTIVFLPVGIVLCAVALFVGIRARRRARRVLTRAPGAVPGIVFASAGLALGALAISVLALVWTPYYHFATCERAALTQTDKQTCQSKYYPQIEKRLHLPAGSLNRYGGGL
jgi:hypothetical protein